MRDVLLTGAVRTPIGDLNGFLSSVSAVELGKISVTASLERSGLSGDQIEEVIVGNVLQAGLGQNPARQIAIGCGVPNTVPSFTVNQVCGSGMKAIDLAWKQVAFEAADVVIAGGIESMSRSPYILPSLRSGSRLGETPALDTVVSDGLTDVFGNYHMGVTAENIAEKYQISRNEQDTFALESQQKCGQAIEKGLFKEEIIPVTIRKKKKETVIDGDEHPRPEVTLEDLARLKAVFKPEGTVTPGNASGINDGAASVIVLADDDNIIGSIDRAACVKVKDLVCCGCEPELMGMGPVYAVQKLLKRQGIEANDIDLWELNEAFAAQSIAVINELKIDVDKVNVNGGAVALGHPIGASGTRIVVTLIREMKRRNSGLGIASLCVGGGMGLAVLLENVM